MLNIKKRNIVSISCKICDLLHDLVPFVQFKKRENTHGGVLLLDLKPATLQKVALVYGCFSRFLNCANGTKSRNASHM